MPHCAASAIAVSNRGKGRPFTRAGALVLAGADRRALAAQAMVFDRQPADHALQFGNLLLELLGKHALRIDPLAQFAWSKRHSHKWINPPLRP